jgi:hypothetical protein
MKRLLLTGASLLAAAEAAASEALANSQPARALAAPAVFLVSTAAWAMAPRQAGDELEAVVHGSDQAGKGQRTTRRPLV